jgi:hypothetical protein
VPRQELVFFRFIGKAVCRKISRDDADGLGVGPGVSCGADSVALLALLKIQAELGLWPVRRTSITSCEGKRRTQTHGVVFAVAEKQNSRKTKPVIACSCGRLRSVLVESS